MATRSPRLSEIPESEKSSNASYAAGATRRAILARLASGDADVSELMKPFNLSQPSISKHLKVLERAGLAVKDIDLFELNEAFAAQMLACTGELKLDETRVNVNGGAIALGHPIGASGARVLVTLLHALQQRGLRRGLACLCLGGGNAVAMIVERAWPTEPSRVP